MTKGTQLLIAFDYPSCLKVKAETHRCLPLHMGDPAHRQGSLEWTQARGAPGQPRESQEPPPPFAGRSPVPASGELPPPVGTYTGGKSLGGLCGAGRGAGEQASGAVFISEKTVLMNRPSGINWWD